MSVKQQHIKALEKAALRNHAASAPEPLITRPNLLEPPIQEVKDQRRDLWAMALEGEMSCLK